MDKEKILQAVDKIKSSLSELESACAGYSESSEKSEAKMDSGGGDKKSMVVALMKKKLGE